MVPGDSEPLRGFATTRWSLIRDASQPGDAAGRAMAKFCELYWYPLYSFARRNGRQPEDARDDVQAFFLHLLERQAIGGAQPEKGRFRTFLLTSFRHFLINAHARAAAMKRGGNALVQLDCPDAERRYLREPTYDLTPARIFDRQCALALVQQTVEELGAHCAATGKTADFEVLRRYLVQTPDATSYAQAAARLGRSVGAVKVAVHRLRRRYAELLRSSIAQTVSEEAEIDQEIRDLFAALA